ncbi:MAG: GDSL-type esterase/lipase family protein [Burkholderiaceae bacterium]
MKPSIRPTAICTAVLLSLTLAACSSSGGKQADAPASALATNPFAPAGARSYDEVHVGTLRVFGDSYTSIDYTQSRGTSNWAVELQTRGRTTGLENYAIGGAKAAKGASIAFDRQLDTFGATGTPIANGDLSIVYFGYNDIGRHGSSDNLRAARAGYYDGVNRLIAAGATNDKNRIFLTQIHDWSRNPRNDPGTASQVVAWNNFVGEQANANPNIVAVDLYTVFNRIYEDPAKYGFANVTSVNYYGSFTDALYQDPQHFGSRGQAIISRTFEHYLTRGWEWANTVAAGAEAAARLNKDIDDELLVLTYADRVKPQTGLRVHALGSLKQAATGTASDATAALRARFNGGNTSGSSDPDRQGFAFSYRPHGETGQKAGRFGMAFTSSQTPRYFSDRFSPLAQKNEFNTTSVYWQQRFGDLDFTAHAAHLRTSYENYKYDDLLNDRFTNSGTGTTWSFEQKLRHTSRQGGVWVSPWMSLTHLSHQLDPMLGHSLYTSDIQYTAQRNGQWNTAIGLDLQSDPIGLGRQRSLRLSAGLVHRVSLQRDPVQVVMRETGGFGAVQRESISLPTTRQTQFQLNAQLQLTPRVDMLATFATDSSEPDNGQSLSLLARLRF